MSDGGPLPPIPVSLLRLVSNSPSVPIDCSEVKGRLKGTPPLCREHQVRTTGTTTTTE